MGNRAGLSKAVVEAPFRECPLFVPLERLLTVAFWGWERTSSDPFAMAIFTYGVFPYLGKNE